MRRLILATLSIACLVLVLAPSAAAEQPAETTAVTPQKALLPFFEALAATQAEDATAIARIAWWGDSAIVSDGYTGQLRDRLQTRFGDAGPGFILAAPTFDGYLHSDARLKRHDWETANVIQGNVRSGHYGYGGIRAASWGGASSTFETQGTPWDRVQVFYETHEKGGHIQLFVDGAGSPTASHDAEAKETVGAVWHYEAAAPIKEVRVRAGGKGKTTLFGIALERKQAGVVLDALGLLGMRARRWDNADAAHMKAQVALRRPDLVVINFGGNERIDGDLTVEKHKSEILAITAMMRAGAPAAACLIVGPGAHGVKQGGKRIVDPALSTIYEAQRAAADEAGCGFLDTIALTGGEDSITRLRKGKLIGGDMAHLNGKGHRYVGDLMADWLLSQYDAWQAAK